MDSNDSALTFHISHITGLVSRLTQLLTTEITLLKQVNIRAIEALQPEKQSLTETLLSLQQHIRNNPALSQGITPAERTEYQEILARFETTVVENYQRLRAARDINAEITRVIRSSVTEQLGTPRYNCQGNDKPVLHGPASLKLNEMA